MGVRFVVWDRFSVCTPEQYYPRLKPPHPLFVSYPFYLLLYFMSKYSCPFLYSEYTTYDMRRFCIECDSKKKNWTMKTFCPLFCIIYIPAHLFIYKLFKSKS